MICLGLRCSVDLIFMVHDLLIDPFVPSFSVGLGMVFSKLADILHILHMLYLVGTVVTVHSRSSPVR